MPNRTKSNFGSTTDLQQNGLPINQQNLEENASIAFNTHRIEKKIKRPEDETFR